MSFRKKVELRRIFSLNRLSDILINSPTRVMDIRPYSKGKEGFVELAIDFVILGVGTAGMIGFFLLAFPLIVIRILWEILVSFVRSQEVTE